VAAGGDRHLQLGADPVGGGDQERIAEAGRLEVEKPAESAQRGLGAGPGRGLGERLDGLDQGVARVDVDPGVLVADAIGTAADYGVLRELGVERRRLVPLAPVASGRPFGRPRIAAVAGAAKILKSGCFAMRIHPPVRTLPVRTIVVGICLLAVGLAGLAAWGRAAMADVEVYQVSGIQVDVTADTATTAREAALAEGHREAYRRLMARLVLEEDQAYVPNLGQRDVAQLVQDFSVVDEKTSAVRYLAELTFRFKPEAVRDLFRANRLRFTETRSKPLLVLPIYLSETGEVLLWEDTNLWAFAWAERDLTEELVPLMIPLGDLGDVAAIDVQRALAGDSAAMNDIALRYGAEGVLVAQAGLVGDPADGAARLDVVADRYDDSAWRIYADSIVQSEPGGAEVLFNPAIVAVVASAQADWKAANHLSFDEQRMLSAIVPVSELGDWLEVKKRLGGIASIVRMDLVTMTRQYAQVDIGFIGDEERLSRALSQSDLALSRSALAGWELRLAGATGGAAVPLGAVVPLSDQGAQPQSEVQSESLSGAEGDGLQEAPAESLSTVE
jgi:hypothetical protein